MPKLVVSFFILIFFLLSVRLWLFFLYKPKLFNSQKIEFTTTLTADPIKYSRYNMLIANYGNLWSYEKVLVIYSRSIKLKAGDKINISGNLKVKNRAVYSTQDNNLLNKSNIIPALYFPNISADKIGRVDYLALFGSIRQKLKEIYYQNLSKEYASFLYGVIIGGKENFTKEFKLDLQSTGVVHVVSASGFNVTMVAGFLFALTAKFFRRQYAVSASILGVLGYMLLSGLAAPVLRAGIISIFAFSAQLLGRQYNRLYGLFLVTVTLLIYDPGFIIDAGFQLTVMAVFGILVIRPLFPKHPALDDIFITLSAQIAILPITLYTFGTIGIASFFVNFLVMWTIAPIMILGSLAAFGFILPIFGFVFTLLCQPFLWWFIEIVKFFGSQNLNIQLSFVPPSLIIGYYLILGSIVYLVNLL